MQGTLHKVSGPLTRDVRQHKMKKGDWKMNMQKLVGIIVSTICAGTALAAPFEIVGYENNGNLTYQGGTISNYYTIEYATAVAGPWTNWGSLSEQPITGNVMVAAGPMFFRIKSTDARSFPPYGPIPQVWVSMAQGPTQYTGVSSFSFTGPSSSEGIECVPLQLTVTPCSPSNTLLLEFNVHISSPDHLGQGAAVFVFKNDDTNALFGAVRQDGYGYGTSGHTEQDDVLSGSYTMTANTSSSIVFKVYVAPYGTSVLKINDTLYGNYGNKLTSTLKVTEIRP